VEGYVKPKTPTLKYSSYGNLRKPFGDYEPIMIEK